MHETMNIKFVGINYRHTKLRVLLPKTSKVSVLADIFTTKRSFGIGVGKENTMLVLHILYIIKIQQDATVCRYLFTAKSLYIFRVSIAPIIRITHIVTVTSGTDHSI